MREGGGRKRSTLAVMALAREAEHGSPDPLIVDSRVDAS